MKHRDELFKTVSLSPFKYLTLSIRKQAYFIVFALVPQVLMLVLTESFASLSVLLAALLASIVAEAFDFEENRKDPFVWTIALIRGCLVGLLLPSTFSPVTVFFVSLVVLFVNRKVLGGFANSWLNPVALTVAVCWLVGMNVFPNMMITIEDLQSRNPTLSLIQNGTVPMLSVDARVTNFLNNNVFGTLGVSIPDGYVSMFWDTKSLIPAFRFNLLTLVTSIFLFSFNVYNLIIPSVFMVVYVSLVRFVAPFFYDGPALQGDVLLALLSSGTLFSWLFLLQWHGTIPLMNRGKFIYGIVAGIVAFCIVGVGSSSVGFVFTVLMMNVASPLIQTVENYFEKRYTESVVAARVKLVTEGLNA
ncbi:MAG: RnfABCDGE type electron transport complex subunit D [Treponema sp.]|nr:RnfABCDGE type electron transport complex subunit D [Treponema sp.]MBR6912625.1 RnfABCDGE type electron transport complex subunit D [Treponema sp.]